MSDIENLRNELVGLIDEKIEALKKKEEPKFKKGQWLVGKISCVYCLLKYDRTEDTGHGYNEIYYDILIWNDTYKENAYMAHTEVEKTLRPATPEEIKSALIKEAERRGYKVGSTVICVRHSKPTTIGGCAPCFVYDNEDRLYYGGAVIYNNGKWAEIIKDETIKIGGYEVKFCADWAPGKELSILGRYTNIDGHRFSKEFWIAAKTISEHSKAKIMVGCSKQYDVSLETINQILKKLND